MQRSRFAVVASMTAVAVYVLGFFVPATVLVERDEHEGYLWAWAVLIRDNFVAVVLVAVLGGLGVAAWMAAGSRRTPGSAAPIASVLAIAASFAFGGALALAIAAPEADQSYEIAVGAAVVALVGLLAGPLAIGPQPVQLAMNTLAVAVLILLVTSAANYEDNSTDPLPVALSLAILGAPLFAIALERRQPLGAVAGRALLGLHLVAVTPLAIAAVSCEDDDCLPAPPWVFALALASIWTLAARLAPHDTEEARPASERSLAIAVAAAAPSTVLLIGLMVAMGVGIDADPTPFASTPPAIESKLPGMLGWTSQRACAGQPAAASTVVVVGADLGASSPREFCFATFDGWSAPAPMVLLEAQGSSSLLDPLTGQQLSIPARFHSEAVEPDGITAVRTAIGRGRTRFEVTRDGGAATTVLELSGGRDYGVWSYGLSDDATWLFVLDSTNRLIVVPVDGSQPPTVLDDRVSDRSTVAWGPGASFAIRDMRLRDPGDSTYIPRDIPTNAMRDLINDQAEGMEQIDVEFVVVDGEVYGRFLGLPAADATERGLCVWLSTRLGEGEMNGVHATVGAGDQNCFPESESQGTRCGTVLALPTGIRADQLTDRMMVGANASLFIPITLEGYETRVTGLKRDRRDWTLGPVTGADLPQLGLDDIRCGLQPS